MIIKQKDSENIVYATGIVIRKYFYYRNLIIVMMSTTAAKFMS